MIGRNERPTESAEWDSSKYTYNTDFRITDVAFREGGEFLFVAGLRNTDTSCWGSPRFPVQRQLDSSDTFDLPPSLHV